MFACIKSDSFSVEAHVKNIIDSKNISASFEASLSILLRTNCRAIRLDNSDILIDTIFECQSTLAFAGWSGSGQNHILSTFLGVGST